MTQDIFGADTAPGSPTTGVEIKTLVCYLLAQTERPLTFEQIHAALREYDLVNYFELVEAVQQLVDSAHILKQEDTPTDYYAITPLGKATAETLDGSLALSVREKALKATEQVLAREERLRELKAEIITLPQGGFRVELAIPEEGTELINFAVYAPTKAEAEKLRRGFLNDPSFIYQAVLALLTGDIAALGDLRPTDEPLFL